MKDWHKVTYATVLAGDIVEGHDEVTRRVSSVEVKQGMIPQVVLHLGDGRPVTGKPGEFVWVYR